MRARFFALTGETRVPVSQCFLQVVSQGGEFAQLVLNGQQFLAGYFSDFVTWRAAAVANFQHSGEFVESEADGQRAPHELHSLQRFSRVLSIPVPGT